MFAATSRPSVLNTATLLVPLMLTVALPFEPTILMLLVPLLILAASMLLPVAIVSPPIARFVPSLVSATPPMLIVLPLM